jgi:hypothetical protein
LSLQKAALPQHGSTSPTKRTIVRFDAGDTIGRMPAQNVAVFFPPAPPAVPFVVFPESAQITHNFQGSVGFGFRF